MENRDDFDNKSKNIKNRKTLKPLRELTCNLKEKNGITMVALVVTIVVLLILSTITIQGITHTGLFSSAENAKLEHKRAYIATTLETKLKISQSEQIRGTDEEIIKATYEDVKNDLDEIKKAGGKDIEVGEVTSEEREGKTEWFFEVKVDGDVYKVALDGSDYLGKENELSPLIQIKTVKSTTNTISVSVTTKRNEGGKVEYYIKEKAASKFTLAKTTDQNEYTYTGLKQDTTFVIKAIAIGKNGKEKESKEVEIETSTVPKIDSKEIEFAVEPNTWTNKSVKVTAKPKVDTQGFTLVTSKNPTSSWTKVDNQTFSTNGTMYVALTDGNNYGVTASHEVTNIDKIKPVITSVTATTNTIKITATDEASGICAYAISESSTMPTKFTVVDSTKIFNKIIENKKQSTKYYVWVKDQAGNVSEVASTTTGTVAGLTDANTTFSKTPNDWTNKDVTLTASTTEKNFALQTKKDNGEWQTTGTQTFTENGTIYARLWDGINAGAETKLNVTNIDKLAPNAFTPKATVTTNSIKVDGTTTDAQATSTNGSSGIKEYRFSKDGGKTYTNAQTSATYTFSGLTQNVEYTIVVEAKDNAGNTTIGTVKATTGTVPTASGATYTPTTWTSGKVTVTLPTKSGYTTVYTTNGTAPTKDSTKYSAAFTVSNNCKINYLYTDGTNIGGAGTVNVTNIDKLSPNAFTPKTTVTTNSIKVDGTTTDATATSTNGSSGIKEYRFSKDGGKTYTNAQTSATYTFSGLTQNVEYTIVVEAKDNAANTTTGTVKATTGIVPTASGATYTPTTWTKGNVTVTLPTKSGYSTVYTTNGTAPTKDSTKYSAAFTVSSNCKINYLYTDGTNIGGAGTVNVTNIDTANPVINTAITGSGTTSTIKLSMVVSDTQSGVNKIIWYYKLSTDSTYKNATDTYTATTANTTRTHTFTGLTQNKTYNAYAVVYDATGRTAQSTTINVTTGTVPTASGATYTPNTWTSGKVTVTLPTKSGYTTVYTTNGTAPTKDSIKYSAAFTVSSNCKINYLYTDGTNIGGAGTVNVTNIDTANPVINTAITGSGTTSTIKLSMAVSDTQSGVNKIIWYYKLSTDSTYKNATDTYTATTANTTRTHTFTGLTQNKTYNAYAVVYDATGRTAQSTTINVTTGTVPTASGATYTPNTWTSGNVTVTLPTKNGYTTVYTTNGTAPTKDSTKYSAAFTVSSNCKINYLYTDGTNIGGAGTVNVTNIDKTAPTFVSGEVKNLTTTGYDVYVYGITDTQSGVNRVQFPTWTNANGQDDIQSNWWEPSNTVAKGTKQADGTTWVYHVNIKDHKNEVGLYYTHVYVYDNLGNSRCVFTPQITVPKVPDITSANASFSYNPKTWTSGSVRATTSTTVSGYYLQTSTDAQTWKTQNYVDRTTNGAVYARLTDGVNVGNYVTGNVGNIDKIAPTTPTLTAKIGNDSGSAYTSGAWTNQAVIITATSSDTQSQINRIEYSYDNSTWNTNWGTSLITSGNNKSIKGTWGTNYNTTVYVRAVDNAGNVSGTASIVVRHDTTAPATPTITAKVGSDSGSAYTSGSWTSQPIIITATSSDTQSQINRIEYSYNNSSWSTSWGTDLTTNGNSKSIKGTWNGNYNNTVYVRAVDNVGNVSASSSIVIREDATAPTINTGISGTATSKSITLSLVASDNLSGVNKIVWYYKDSTASSYTSATDTYTATTAQTTRTHTFTGLTQNKTYNAYAVVYDAVGRTTQSSTINVSTVQVPNLATTNGKFTYSTTNWTNGNVTATASTTIGGYSIQTSTDASNWSTNASISRSSNGKVYARLWDGKNAGGYLTGNISNIDKTNISISSFTASPSSTIATVATLSATVNDANSGLSTIVWQWGTTTNYGNSSTSIYTTKNGATAGTTGAVTKTFSLTGLSASTTYYVKMTAYDVAGNSNTSTTSFTTGKAVAQVGSIYYTSVQNAIDSVESTGTVKMIADSTLETAVQIDEEKNITIELNEKNISKIGTESGGVIKNYGKLTISGSGNITSDKDVIYNYNKATLTINSGTLSAADGWTLTNFGTCVIYGGSIKFTGPSTGCALMNKGNLTMRGGTISSSGFGLVTRGGTSDVRNSGINIQGSNVCIMSDESGLSLYENITVSGLIINQSGTLTLWNCNMNKVTTVRGNVMEIENASGGYNVYFYDSASTYSKVQFPTWTSNNGQDDIQWYTAAKGTRHSTVVWYYGIRKSNHKNETGVYNTHVYANGKIIQPALTYTVK